MTQWLWFAQTGRSHRAHGLYAKPGINIKYVCLKMGAIALSNHNISSQQSVFGRVDGANAPNSRSSRQGRDAAAMSRRFYGRVNYACPDNCLSLVRNDQAEKLVSG
jgi:hypothetical protein